MNAVVKYPVYVPSKNRSHIDMTVTSLIRDGVEVYVVVEEADRQAYTDKYGADRILVLPESNRGLIYARNWIFEHAVASGAERHWQIDDNIRRFKRLYRQKRLNCPGNVALRCVEDFTDRFDNVALAGMNYTCFAMTRQVPFNVNVHVYSCTLILNSLPYRFREPANEDVDMCLQVLSNGWCTILFNAFLAEKMATMTVQGGQTKEAYQGDGRLFMARALEKKWPGVVETKRRFNRPQHVIKDAWKRFDTPLHYKDGKSAKDFRGQNDYNLRLRKVGDEVRSDRLRAMVEDGEKEHG